MGERVCLRCDWTGETDGPNCPKCGAALYRLPEFTEPREATRLLARNRVRRATRCPGSAVEADQHDESVPPAAPPDGRGRALIVGALTVVAIGA